MQKYQIMSAIGEGAYGVVLKCREVESGGNVAIKKFKDSDDEELAKKTSTRQVKILKMLNHANIVQMKQAFKKKGIVYLVFQYVENNLLEVLEKSPSGLHPNLIRKLMYQLVKGLAYLHRLDIVHRDIKPENLLVSAKNQLKICDFGFARQTRKQKGEQQLTQYVATRWYRPPELLVEGEYGKQIDMWAVGCIMCELIDGMALLPGENELDQLFLIQKTFGPLPYEINQRFNQNPRFMGMKFPEIHNIQSIEKRYAGKMDHKGLNLIKSLLKMRASERMTAQQALNHPYFQTERVKDSIGADAAQTRKQVYTSTTTRKKQQFDFQSNLDRMTKYGKIYNKRKTNYNAIAMIYQSSNNCKTQNQYQSKSVGKNNNKKMMTNYNQNISLQKHHNKQILLKTEAKGFYIEGGEDKLTGYGDSPRKNQDLGWQSTSHLPFLLMVTNGSQNQQQQAQPKTSFMTKKKPQIAIQKTNTSSTSSNTPAQIPSNMLSVSTKR